MIFILIIILAFIFLFIYCCLKISSISALKDKLGIKSPSKEFANISDSFRAVALPLCCDDNVNYFLQKMDNLEIDNKHQKKIIDRLSRKIQRLRTKIRELENLNYTDVLNLNGKTTNQKIIFRGRTYRICSVMLKQEVGCIDELIIISHDIFGDLYDKK